MLNYFSKINNYKYYIIGPEQIRPENFSVALKNITFKKSFITFLIEHWSTDEAAELLTDKTVFISYEKCYEYTKENGTLSIKIKNNLKCEGHDEADTKFPFFINKLTDPCSIVIQCSDTDIFIILLANKTKIQLEHQIFLEFGTGNNIRYININKTFEVLGEKLSSALPAFHAFTGCDFNPGFFNIGKIKPFKILEKNEDYQEAFANIDDINYHEIIEKFVCEMYATKKNGLQKLGMY